MNDPTVQALGLALIHSLWECSLVTLLFALFTFLFRGSNARYLAGCLAMLLMLAIPAITFFGILDSATTTAVAVATSGTSLAQPGPSSMADSQTVVRSSEPSSFFGLIVWLWLTGVIAMTAWSAAGWITAQRLKRRSTRPIAESWRQRVTVLAGRLRIRRTVRVYESILAQVPAVIGWIRPVILVPAGALIHLSAEELEAVLAHELAHIRRHDYLINLLQTAIETLLFYHPAVWWIGRRIRAEREHCCDDLAVQTCGDRIVYARALTSLEELRCGDRRFAMAATGGDLGERVRRLLGASQPMRRRLPFVLLAGVTILVASVALLNTRAQATDRNPVEAATAEPAASPEPAAQPEPPASPAPAAEAAVAPVTPEAPEAPEAPTRAPVPQPAPAPQIAQHHAGYLGGLADAGYTSISVDEIIELKQNGVNPDFIKEMLHAGFGVLSPKELIALKNNGVSPDYARSVKSSGLRDANVDGVIRLHQHGVNPRLLEALGAAGYSDVNVSQAIQAQDNGLSGDALRSLREQGFKNLTLEQVIKLKRAGVI